MTMRPKQKSPQEELAINRSDIVRGIAAKFKDIDTKDSELAVRLILDAMATALTKGQRIEIRNFGVMQTKTRLAVTYRNPRTGEKLVKRSSKLVRFKEGKNLRKRLATDMSARA